MATFRRLIADDVAGRMSAVFTEPTLEEPRNAEAPLSGPVRRRPATDVKR